MAFGPTMKIQREGGTPIILSAIEQKDLKQLPNIDSEQAKRTRRFVTRAFIEDARTLHTPNPTHYYEWRDSLDSVQWGIYAKRRKLSRYVLVGQIGINNIEQDPELGRIGHSRVVIMNDEFHGQHIGPAATEGRTYYAFHPNGGDFDRLHSRVDIRNDASYATVHSQGYRCFDHTPPKGPLEPDWERHLLELPNPHMPFELLPPLYHHEDSWQQARLSTREILRHAQRAVKPLLD